MILTPQRQNSVKNTRAAVYPLTPSTVGGFNTCLARGLLLANSPEAGEREPCLSLKLNAESGDEAE